ncbi:MAG TPA: hypothetical protein VM029_01800 [Opitutaceae bacterium]|nr:hypothetical protein [Opitutaceae bacterium]
MNFLRSSAALFAAGVFTAVASAMSVVPPTFPELVAEAQTIVRGTVTQVRSEEFDTPQGRGIRTLVTLQVERTLKGAPDATLTLTVFGGTVGRRTLGIAGMPQFAVGERQFLFVADNGRVFCPLIGIGHGRYHVRTEAATGREYVARDNGLPLASTEEVVMPLAANPIVARLKTPATALAPADFESRIAATVAQQILNRHQR